MLFRGAVRAHAATGTMDLSSFFIGLGVGVFLTCVIGFVALIASDNVECDEVDEHKGGGI